MKNQFNQDQWNIKMNVSSPFKHDITHCSGSDVRMHQFGGTEIIYCEKRRDCYRYKAYLDIHRPNVVSMLMPLQCIDNDHEMYMPCQN